MTLSRWLRDYVYIPLGGSRGSKARTARNILITMVLGGLWHGAAWTFVAASQYLLGIRPEHEGLRVSPCLPAEIPEFTVTRRCRGATYSIHVKNSGKGGRAQLRVNGKPIDGEVVPWARAGASVDIHCVV